MLRIFCVEYDNKNILCYFSDMFQNLLSQSGISLERLASFCDVAELGSIAAAAKNEPARQSLISRQIRELQEYFGVELVRRKGRGLELTDSGKELAAVGRENFKGIKDFAAHCKESEWTVQIVASNSVAFWHLVPAIKSLQAQAKGVRFEIHHEQTREMANATREGIYDIAFVREDAIPTGMKRASLGSVGRSLLIPKALAPTRPKTLAAALVSIPLALPIGGSVRENAEQLAAKTGKPLRIALGCTSYIQAAQALETEACGTVLPDLAKPALKLEKFHVFALPEKYNLCMAWSKRSTDTRPQLLSLIGTMQSVLKWSGK